jgi:DNA-directed RNA polymerase specialized sigma24 family protein
LNDLDAEERLRFEELVLPQVDAAFNLPRWLLRTREDAEEVAQEALLRACRFFRGFHGENVRAWAAADRAQYVLLLAGEKSPEGTDGRI